jgi:DNA-directed RNA polymerase subunit beta
MRVGSGILAFVADEALTLKVELKKGVRLTKEIVEKLKKGGIVSLPISRDILLGKSSVGRVENPLTGESLLETASIIDQHALAELDKLSNLIIEVLGDTLNGDTSCLINTLAHDHISDVSVAAREVYGRIKPGDVPSVKVMEEYIKSMLFNPKYYDLTSVGRLRINRKFGLNVPLDGVALNLEDILATVRYLINLQEKGEGVADDIDELSNRCVRLVDELLQVQAYLGFSRIEKIAREKLRLVEGNISYMPYDFINVKPMAAVLGAFFGTGQLSQFMDQTNPLSEMAHKRRLSALGHGSRRSSISLW